MKIIKSIDFGQFISPRIEIAYNKKIPIINKLTVGIFGSSTSFPLNTNFEKLKKSALLLGKGIGKMRLNVITTGSPGIPYWVAKSAKASGATVWTISQFSSQNEHKKTTRDKISFPIDQNNIALYTGFDQELVNYLVSCLSDIGIVISGGLGTLIKSSLVCDWEKPVVCINSFEGIAQSIPEIFKKTINEEKEFNLFEVSSISQAVKKIEDLTSGKILLENKLQRVARQIFDYSKYYSL